MFRNDVLCYWRAQFSWLGFLDFPLSSRFFGLPVGHALVGIYLWPLLKPSRSTLAGIYLLPLSEPSRSKPPWVSSSPPSFIFFGGVTKLATQPRDLHDWPLLTCLGFGWPWIHSKLFLAWIQPTA